MLWFGLMPWPDHYALVQSHAVAWLSLHGLLTMLCLDHHAGFELVTWPDHFALAQSHAVA